MGMNDGFKYLKNLFLCQNYGYRKSLYKPIIVPPHPDRKFLEELGAEVNKLGYSDTVKAYGERAAGILFDIAVYFRAIEHFTQKENVFYPIPSFMEIQPFTGFFATEKLIFMEVMYMLFPDPNAPIVEDSPLTRTASKAGVSFGTREEYEAKDLRDVQISALFTGRISEEQSVLITNRDQVSVIRSGKAAFEDALKFSHPWQVEAFIDYNATLEQALKFDELEQILALETGKCKVEEALQIKNEEQLEAFKNGCPVEVIINCFDRCPAGVCPDVKEDL